jgi:hypothetical protein
MSKAETIINESLSWARENNYKIITTSCAYDYVNGKLVGVNAIGSVMLKYGFAKSEKDILETEEGIPDSFPYYGWLKDCCEVLGEDTYWIWKFMKGFDQGINLKIYKSDCWGTEKEETDTVSAFGVKMRKKYKGT